MFYDKRFFMVNAKKLFYGWWEVFCFSFEKEIYLFLKGKGRKQFNGIGFFMARKEKIC